LNLIIAFIVNPNRSFQISYLLAIVSLEVLDLLSKMAEQCSLSTAVGQHEVDQEAEQSGDGILDAGLAEKQEELKSKTGY